MKDQPCLIVLNGQIPQNDLIEELWNGAGLKICADGAIDKLESSGFKQKPDFIVGDGDSISEDAKYKHRNIMINNEKQSQTDSEKSIEFAIDKKVKLIDIIGADGVRTDHFIYNLFLLRKYTPKVFIRFWNDHEVIFYKNNNFKLEAELGRKISLISLYENAHIINSSGLKYPLNNEVLSGDTKVSISNEVASNPVSVDLRGGGVFVFLEYKAVYS